MKKKRIGLILFIVMVWIAVNILQAQETYRVYMPIARFGMATEAVGEPPQPGGLD